MVRPFSLLTPTAQSFIHSSSQQDTAPMNPIFLHPPSPFTLLSNTNEETILDQQPPHLVQDQQHLLLFTPTKPSFPYPIFFDTNQRQEHDDPDDYHDFNYQEDEEEGQVEEQFSRGVRNSNLPPPPSHPILINPKIEISKMDSQDEEHVPGSVNSTRCLKERIANSDQTVPIKPLRKRHHYYCSPQLSSINNNNSGRVCSDCNTTKTPLWRSGPQGPKSLCNACGIRHRKARRAMAAAAAGATNVGLDKDVAMKKKVHKDKRVDPKFTTQYRKRCKIATAPTRKKLCFEMDFDTESNSSSNLHYPTKKTLDFSVGLSKSSGDFHRVFPEDEHEAAILLMALSCGLVRSR